MPSNGSPVRRVVGGGSQRGTPTRSRTPQPALSVRGVDPKLVQLILDEIVEGGPKVHWEDIAGQEVCIFLLHLISIFQGYVSPIIPLT